MKLTKKQWEELEIEEDIRIREKATSERDRLNILWDKKIKPRKI